MATAALPLVISGLSALSGLFGKKEQTDTTTKRTGTTDQTSTPFYSPEDEKLKNYLSAILRNRVLKGPDMSGYEATGVQSINRAADIKKKALQNILSARGLSYSPVAATSSMQNEADRINQVVSFVNQLPLLQYQLQGEDLNSLMNFFARLPVGTKQVGTTSETSTGQQTGSSGGGIGGLLSGLGQGIAGTYGYGYGLDQFQKRFPGSVPRG